MSYHSDAVCLKPGNYVREDLKYPSNKSCKIEVFETEDSVNGITHDQLWWKYYGESRCYPGFSSIGTTDNYKFIPIK